MVDFFSEQDFLNKIKELKSAGLSDAQIGEDLGVAGPTVGRWLDGSTKIANLKVGEYSRILGRLPMIPTEGKPTSRMEAEAGRLYQRGVMALRQLAEKGYLRSLRAVTEMLSVLAKTD